jgi:predicted ArsR family transcriptional regulator
MATANTIRAVAVLDDRLRGALYDHVRAARRPVTRDEAAAAVGISRKLAAFHLEKLVSVGLLRVVPAPAGPRRVGRAPKAYEPTDAEIQVSIPARQHSLLAAILMDAVLSEAPDETGSSAAIRVARQRGEELGAAERTRTRPGRLGAERALTMAERTLTDYGFEPDRATPRCVQLRNCPFHPLTANAPELVCGLNHAFLSGFLDGLDATSVDAVLEPRAGECCVELRARPRD